MSNIAIRVNQLSKSYRMQVGQQSEYQTLRDQITKMFFAPFRPKSRENGAQRTQDKQQNLFWALKNVNLEIKQGEIVGLIGKNGAGKSTLLKILTRITEPTSGTVDIYGRVGSLIEVGTGFHKELTGKENIYLNGAILGMRKAEIDRKYDEIVTFAEMENFVNAPVKFYSSGMTVRLAFAVAAHLEPELLLVDEVLAVGDAAFQRKCLAKMEDAGKSGRTIIFVSHHIPSITRLCERAVLLDRGQVINTGPTHEIVAQYLSSSLGTSAIHEWDNPALAPGSDTVRLRSVRIKDRQGTTGYTYRTCQDVGVEMEYEVLQPGCVLYPYFTLHNEEIVWLFTSIDLDPAWRGKPRPVGRYRSTGWIPGNMLSEGTMLVGPAMRTEEPFISHFYEREAAAFQVVEAEGEQTARGDFSGKLHGVVRPLLNWETEIEEECVR